MNHFNKNIKIYEEKENKKNKTFFLLIKIKQKCLKINLTIFTPTFQNMLLVLFQWELLTNLYINNL